MTSNRTSGRVSAALVTLSAVLVAALSSAPAAAYPRPGNMELLSVSSNEKQGAYCNTTDLTADGCPQPVLESSSVSADGRYVAFSSAARGLVKGDFNNLSDVFVRDRKTGRTRIVSVSSQGEIAIGPPDGVGFSTGASSGGGLRLSYDPSISANGRYVAFTSGAVNLVKEDTNGAIDVFVHDLKKQTTERVSLDSQGREGKLDLSTVRPEALLLGSRTPDSFYPSISANGRYVSFTSFASNFAEKDKNGWSDIFVRDIKKGRTERITVTPKGGEAQTFTCVSQLATCRPWRGRSSISASGRWVVFDSTAADLVKGDTNLLADVFVRDRTTKKTERVSVDSSGEEATNMPVDIFANAGSGSSLSGADPYHSADRAISADGRFVVFTSKTDNLIPNDANRAPPQGTTGDWAAGQDVYVRDRRTNRTQRVSVTSIGHETNLPGKSAPGGAIHYHRPSISSNGRFVAFQGTGLISGAYKDVEGIYVHDLTSGSTEYISRMSYRQDDHASPEGGESPDISSSGRYVSFTSGAWPEDRSDKDETAGYDHFLHDRGAILSAGPQVQSPKKDDKGGEPPICVASVCLPPGAAIASNDATPEASLSPSAELLGASLAYRDQGSDLFLNIEVERLDARRHAVAFVGDLSTVYGARFSVSGKTFELRAAPDPIGGAAIGLFACPRSSACVLQDELLGGFGTTGERIGVSIPTAAVGLHDGGRISSLEVFSARGTYLSGPHLVLDTFDLR